MPSDINAECEDLGRRCASAKMRLDERAPQRFQDAFLSYAGTRKVPPYFERKWLSLRLSAVKRGMVVDKSVTPSFLQHIFDGRCPVTLEPLDVAERSSRNPSVDRLVNELGYVAGNICMLSLRANRAKADRTFEDVAAVAQAGFSAAGLAPVEWMRLTSLMYGAWARAYKRADPWLMPLAATPGRGMFMSTSQAVQLFLMRGLGPDGRVDEADARWLELTANDGCDGGLYRRLRDLLTDAMDFEENPCMAWLHDEVFTSFERWYVASKEPIISTIESTLMERQRRLSEPVANMAWGKPFRFRQ